MNVIASCPFCGVDPNRQFHTSGCYLRFREPPSTTAEADVIAKWYFDKLEAWNARAALSAAPAATGTRDIEGLAANVHDQWMEAKRAQGFASRRSESGEELMVAYALLSEPQKEMDRTLVRTVLRAIDASAPSPAPHAEEYMRAHFIARDVYWLMMDFWNPADAATGRTFGALVEALSAALGAAGRG